KKEGLFPSYSTLRDVIRCGLCQAGGFYNQALFVLTHLASLNQVEKKYEYYIFARKLLEGKILF
ncbi:MAG: hypothetical protein ACLFUB_21520, partial [Cyclobacteriaceae bacterium]